MRVYNKSHTMRRAPLTHASAPSYPPRRPLELWLKARLRQVGVSAATAALLGLTSCGATVRHPGQMIAPDPAVAGDRDSDGIPDTQDSCPDEPEDEDGFEDSDGCYDHDDDGDGMDDASDLCPNEAEDRDGYDDGDGCPDPDNDQDRIADGDDQCPNEAEVYNGTDDTDGCPDQGRVIVRTAGVVSALERVYFVQGSTTVPEISRPILDAVADVLSQNPEIELIEIQGFSDSTGSEQQNLDISQARASAVLRYLIAQGVEPQRLRATGCGAHCPIAPEDTAEGRERNRRVEFYIVRRAGNDETAQPDCTQCVPAP